MDPRLDIITTLNTLFWATDHHDWDTLAHVFSDQVTLDYGEPELLSPQEIIDRWSPYSKVSTPTSTWSATT